MRFEDGIVAETLRCLRAEQAVSRDGLPALAAMALQGIGHGNERESKFNYHDCDVNGSYYRYVVAFLDIHRDDKSASFI